MLLVFVACVKKQGGILHNNTFSKRKKEFSPNGSLESPAIHPETMQ